MSRKITVILAIIIIIIIILLKWPSSQIKKASANPEVG